MPSLDRQALRIVEEHRPISTFVSYRIVFYYVKEVEGLDVGRLESSKHTMMELIYYDHTISSAGSQVGPGKTGCDVYAFTFHLSINPSSTGELYLHAGDSFEQERRASDIASCLLHHAIGYGPYAGKQGAPAARCWLMLVDHPMHNMTFCFGL